MLLMGSGFPAWRLWILGYFDQLRSADPEIGGSCNFSCMKGRNDQARRSQKTWAQLFTFGKSIIACDFVASSR